MEWLTVPLLVACLFLAPAYGQGEDPTAAVCYITVSDGLETCYYYPPTGYDCEWGYANQDPNKRNLTACDSIGLCYVPLAGGKEVCYYSAPYGYNCYFELIPKLVANMTHCDLIKANSAPEINLGSGGARSADEDTIVSFTDITISDLDADESIREGKGFMQVTIQTTRGFSGFDKDASGLSPTEKTDASFALDPANDKFNGGVEWLSGNGTFATSLMFLARLNPLGKIMKALVFKGEQDFNSHNGLKSSITVNVNDQGNTGGTAEQDEKSITITVNDINDPPEVSIPAQNAVNEDTIMSISNLVIVDVDVDESSDPRLTIIVLVTKGTLSTSHTLSVPDYVLFSQLNRKVTVHGTKVGVNAVLATLTYTPDEDTNDLTSPGYENMTIDADDLGHSGATNGNPTSTSITVPLHILPVNDHPVVFTPGFLLTDEDKNLTGLNVTISDVDSYSGITVRLSVSHGTLGTSGPPVVISASPAINYTGTLTQIAQLMSNLQYSPDQDFNGDDYLLINADDGQVFDHAAPLTTLRVVVDAVNDPPTLFFSCSSYCGTGDYVPGTNEPKISPPGGSQLFNNNDAGPLIEIKDVDSADEWVQLLVSVSKGTLEVTSLSGLGEVTIPADPNCLLLANNCQPDILLLLGTKSTINTVISGLTYRHTLSGDDEMIIAVNDLQHTGKGQAGTAVKVFTIYA